MCIEPGDDTGLGVPRASLVISEYSDREQGGEHENVTKMSVDKTKLSFPKTIATNLY